MTNISKRRLPKKKTKQLFMQLSLLMAQSTTKNTELLLSDLLGYEERTMLAKRLAAIIMLQRGASIYKTSDSLKISTATAAKIEQKLADGEYVHLVTLIKKNSASIIDILETIDSILHLGGMLPHYGQTMSSRPRKRPH